MQINRLLPVFAAELIGADPASPPEAALIDIVEQAMRDFGVLAVRASGRMDDDAHIRIGQACEPRELPPSFGKPARRLCAKPFDDINPKRDLCRTTISDPRRVQAPAMEQAAASA